jgi:hypothetical protein
VCATHDMQRCTVFRLPVDLFIAHPDVAALPSFGPCMVASCPRARPGKSPYCLQHTMRFRKRRNLDPDVDEMVWRAVEPPIPEENTVSLRGLPAGLVAEILYGVQARTAEGTKTRVDVLRTVCDRLRTDRAASVFDQRADPGGVRDLANELLRSIRKHVKRTGLDLKRK